MPTPVSMWAPKILRTSSSLKLKPASVMETCECFWEKKDFSSKKAQTRSQTTSTCIKIIFNTNHSQVQQRPSWFAVPSPTTNWRTTNWCPHPLSRSNNWSLVTIGSDFSVLECVKCYSCGYKKDGLDGEMGKIPDVPFCNGRVFFFSIQSHVFFVFRLCHRGHCGSMRQGWLLWDAEGILHQVMRRSR